MIPKTWDNDLRAIEDCDAATGERVVNTMHSSNNYKWISEHATLSVL